MNTVLKFDSKTNTQKYNNMSFLNLLMKNIDRSIYTALVVALTVGSFFYGTVSVAKASTYQGLYLGQKESQVIVSPGERKQITVKFKNTGTQVWHNEGEYAVSLLTVDPLRRRSFAEDQTWKLFFRPAVLPVDSVLPGESVTIKFWLHAPLMAGLSKENFQLASGFSLIPQTKFTIDFLVKQSKNQEIIINNLNSEQIFSVSKDTGKFSYPVMDTSYDASVLIKSFDNVVLQAGEKKKYRIGFKNTGVSTWDNAKNRFVSLYTVNPNYHKSLFANDTWESASQIKMETEQVRRGQIGYFSFDLTAPDRAGNYIETFRLAVEEHSWIANSEFSIQIRVVPSSLNNKNEQVVNIGADKPLTKQLVEVNSNKIVQSSNIPFQTFKLIQSQKKVVLKPNETMVYTVGFKNTGTQTWVNRGGKFVSLYTWGPRYRLSSFFASSQNNNWINPSQIKMETDKVAPGQIGYFRFVIKAPSKVGKFTERFMLASENTAWVSGGELEIPIEVINESVSNINTKINTNTNLTSNPIMRVGLFSTRDEIRVTASGPFEVRDSKGNLVASVREAGLAIAQYDFASKKYNITVGAIKKVLDNYVRFQPINDSVIMEVINYERRAPWKKSINFNRWRGALELRYSNKTGRLWVINELPMEQYLKGIAETSNRSPVEFLKVMSIVARTYATYHYERQTKHADEYYYVDSNNDQVYRGYTAELLLGNLSDAVNATKGLVVKYDGKIAITPYFSQSDGRTRNWSEVWGGSVPWAKSVSVPQDKGKRLLGHGVGMSARGALLMVMNDGKTYEQVLKYFYTGIDVSKY